MQLNSERAASHPYSGSAEKAKATRENHAPTKPDTPREPAKVPGFGSKIG